ncbi:MAG: response regulator [Pseudomonadota bacterium]
MQDAPSDLSRARVWRRTFLALAGGALLSGAAGIWVQHQVAAQAESRFELLAQREIERLQEVLERHSLGLRGARGLFIEDAETVTAEQFDRYVDSRDLRREFPGALAWAYIERLPGAEAGSHLLRAHGIDWLPTLPGSDAEVRVLRLLAPAVAGLPARGSDMAALERLAPALSGALHNGLPMLSAPVTWNASQPAPGLVLALPVYRGVRTPGNVSGWIVTLLDPATLLQFLGAQPGTAERLDIVVRDVGSPGAPGSPPLDLFRLPAPAHMPLLPPGAPPLLSHETRIEIYGRNWDVRFQTRPGFYSQGERWLPGLTAGALFLFSTLATVLLLLRARLRQEVETRASAITRALRERKQLLRSTLAALPEPVLILDARGEVLDCHLPPGAGWLAGTDCRGRSLRSLLPPAAGAECEARLAEATIEGESRFEFVSEERPPRRYQSRLCRRLDEAGQAVGHVLTVRDITAAHAELETLRRDEQKYRQLFMDAPQAILLMSRGHYLDANPAALALLGVPNLAALQHVSTGMLSPLLQQDGRPSLEAGREVMARTLAEGPQITEWVFRRLADGEVFPARVSSRAVTIDGTTCFLNALTDLSTQKRTESALVQARDAAEAATREKSDFLATMSHEIRTPMNGVLGMAQLLANTPLDQEQRDYLATIQQSGQALLTIINDILDFSKIEAGKLSFEEAPFDLQIAIEETCELLLPQLREKKLALTLRLDPATPFQVIGDPGRFRQILLNYLSNALKFTPQGGVTVALRAREQGRGAAFYELSVADTGIGIDPSKQERLFQKFAQADASTTRRFGGTGLGLAICKALVERMGGEVSMSSTPGQGSVFRATFWMSLDPNAPQQALPVLQPTLRSCHVLVLDSSDAWRAPLVQGLITAGLSASGAASLEAALESARQLPPRFVLLDAEHGDGDTAALADALRGEPGLLNATLLALSARPDRNDLAFCREHGIAAWLPRPVRLPWVIASLNILAHGEHDGVVTRQTLVMHLARGKPLPTLRRGIRVLLAEDNAVNQKVAARMLEKMGCHVDMAGNGLEAIVMVSQLPYDLVLMDVQMPEMDGITATRSLRAQGFAELPIIALTANNREADRKECREAGMNDFLAKPIRYEDLHACLCRWVRTARAPAALAGGDPL